MRSMSSPPCGAMRWLIEAVKCVSLLEIRDSSRVALGQCDCDPLRARFSAIWILYYIYRILVDYYISSNWVKTALQKLSQRERMPRKLT
jgi:hypothetical protein